MHLFFKDFDFHHSIKLVYDMSFFFSKKNKKQSLLTNRVQPGERVGQYSLLVTVV